MLSGCIGSRAWRLISLAGMIACLIPLPLTGGDGLPAKAAWASIALIIDDLGNHRDYDQQAIMLPGPVACAFLPHGRHTRQLALQAHSHDKEVMLHLPMQAVNDTLPERGTLTLDMTRLELQRVLSKDLDAVPHVSGVNNHQGSLLTRHPGHMSWLMQAIRQQDGLFFVDSRTTSTTVARKLAHEHGVPSIERNIFLDHDRDVENVRAQFRRLLDIAREHGTALGIGHPYPETLAVLEEEIAALETHRIKLVSVARLIELKHGRNAPWQTSSSRWPRAVKNSRPSL
jgi:polysaccharide deacetylase 2 family uncharacterized protein YibQ